MGSGLRLAGNSASMNVRFMARRMDEFSKESERPIADVRSIQNRPYLKAIHVQTLRRAHTRRETRDAAGQRYPGVARYALMNRSTAARVCASICTRGMG